MGVNGYTNTCILIGHPVGHSLSPAMHNSAFRELGLNWIYVPCQVAENDLSAAINGIRALNIKGANVTIPHKEKVIPFLDKLTFEAKTMGAVNTIVNENGWLVGHNTDGAGFVRSLIETSCKPCGKRIIILGTGGAAKGVAVALAQQEPEEINIIYRSLEKAWLLQQTLTAIFSGRINIIPFSDKKQVDLSLKEAHLLINTTPVGMYPNINQEPLISLSPKHRQLLVADLIYNPLETNLLKRAKDLGCVTLSGLGMFVYQGALAFEYWTKKTPPVQVMQETVLAHMGFSGN